MTLLLNGKNLNLKIKFSPCGWVPAAMYMHTISFSCMLYILKGERVAARAAAAKVHDAVPDGNCERRFRPTIANYDYDDDDIIICGRKRHSV